MSVNAEPRYKHDCKRCVFLGRHERYDLYFCDQGGGLPTVIARYSSDGPDYISGLHNTVAPLKEAYVRAVATGLIG